MWPIIFDRYIVGLRVTKRERNEKGESGKKRRVKRKIGEKLI